MIINIRNSMKNLNYWHKNILKTLIESGHPLCVDEIQEQNIEINPTIIQKYGRKLKKEGLVDIIQRNSNTEVFSKINFYTVTEKGIDYYETSRNQSATDR